MGAGVQRWWRPRDPTPVELEVVDYAQARGWGAGHLGAVSRQVPRARPVRLLSLGKGAVTEDIEACHTAKESTCQ